MKNLFFADSVQKGAEAKSAQTADGCGKQGEGCDSEIKNPVKILSRDTGDHGNNNIKCRFVCWVEKGLFFLNVILHRLSQQVAQAVLWNLVKGKTVKLN